MWERCQAVRELSSVDLSSLPETLTNTSEPLIIRGLVSDWPLVSAGQDSNQAAIDYLNQFYNKKPVHTLIAEPQEKGRYFYNESLTGFNFSRHHMLLNEMLDRLLTPNQIGESLYVGSTSVNHILPGLRQKNDIEALQDTSLVSIWIGNHSRIAAHYDIPDNLAAVAVGKRRFTLFPPDQLDNLYVGPLDFTPAGQPASLVDFHQPDFDKHPKFKHAVEQAQIAELEAGDAIFIPSMWWHHVEGLGSLNILINYWWRQTEAFMAAPSDALNHALLSIRDLPANQRKIWQQVFEHYVFNPQSNEHIPQHARGSLAPLDDISARKLRAQLINKLNR